MYRAVLFDLDDTLYDFRVYRANRLHRALAHVLEHYPHLDRERLVQAALAEGVFIEQFAGFLHRCGVADEGVVAAAQELYQRGWFTDLVMADDAVATFEALRPRFRLGLITNGPSWAQRPKIERFGLAEYMDVLIVSEEVGVAKPDPAIFRIALERLQLRPDEAIFVGDSPEYDLCGAAAAGVPFIWMNPRHEDVPSGLPPPLATIERLAALPPLLEELCR